MFHIHVGGYSLFFVCCHFLSVLEISFDFYQWLLRSPRCQKEEPSQASSKVMWSPCCCSSRKTMKDVVVERTRLGQQSPPVVVEIVELL